MASTGSVSTPQTIQDAQQPVPGIPGSRVTFFLRSTPPPFTVLVAGQSNQDFAFRAVEAFDAPLVLLESRRFAGNRPFGLTISLEATITGTGTVSPDLALSLPLSASIVAAGALSPNLTKTASLAASISSPSDVRADLAGGSFRGTLSLTPEAEDQALAADAEAGDSLTLTSEDSSSLDLGG